MPSSVSTKTQIAAILILLSVVPPLMAILLDFLGMGEELTMTKYLIALYGLSAAALSFLISLLVFRNSEGELRKFTGALSLSLLFTVIYFILLYSAELRGESANYITSLPCIVAYLPILAYGVKKLETELSFLTPRSLMVPVIVSCGLLLAIAIYPKQQHILVMMALDLITIFIFLSLTFLYLKTENLTYWLMISLFYLLQFPAKIYLDTSEFFGLPAMFYNLSLSVLLFCLYGAHTKKVRVLSFKALEEEKKRYAMLLDRVNEMKEAFRLMSKALYFDVLKKLQLISGFVEVYDLTKDPQYLERAIKSVKECGEYIEKIGSLEKTVTAETTNLKPIRVREVVEEIKSGYEIPITIKGSCTVLAGDEISIAIENIIENAVKHSGTERIDVVLSEIDDEGEIKIIDYGIGIPSEIKKELFKEGFKYGETAGLGFGLYIVKKIVERYGGRVWVEDTKPRGATFVIRLKTTQTSEPQ